jgi:hypothetical protein
VVPVVSIPEYLLPLLGIESLPRLPDPPRAYRGGDRWHVIFFLLDLHLHLYQGLVGVLLVERDALDGELVVALQLVSHPISLAVQLEVHVKHLNLRRGSLSRAVLELRDRPLRVKEAVVLGEELSREVVFNG